VIRSWPFPRAEALPTYAFVVTDEAKARARARGADLIDLGLGNPDRPTPHEIVLQLESAARIGKNHRYHPGRGLLELRQALARWYERRYSVSFDVEREIIVTMGAKEGISHLSLAILDRGDTAVVPDPCYPIHMGAPLIAGADVAFYEVSSRVDAAAAIAATLQRLRADAVQPKLVITCYPHNPTGQVVSREQLCEIVRLVRDSGAMLLHDAAYADLDFESRHAPSIFDCGVDPTEVRRFAVEVFSMSKSYNMPGWRVAFMVGNQRLVSALAHLKTYMDYGTFMPLQYAAAWALDNGDHLVDEIRTLYMNRARNLVREFRAAGWENMPEPAGTMFVFAPLPAELRGLSSLEATNELIDKAEVAVAPGSGFGPGGEGMVRFALLEDPPRVAEAAARIRRFLQSRR
jgi:alanine-synthesizing transaminase